MWESCTPETLQNLENVHFRAAILIHKIHPSVRKIDVLQMANWKSVSYMYKRRVACLTHQTLYDKELIAHIQDLVTIQSPTTNMRDNLKLALQKSNIEEKHSNKGQQLCGTRYQNPLKKLENYSAFQKHLTKHSRTLNLVTFNNPAMVKNKDMYSFCYF